MAQHTPRIGFDFDGVIMYNPARAIRRPMSFFKKHFLPARKSHFLYPKGRIAQWINHLLHKSSFKPSQGYKDVVELSKNGSITPFIITARWSFLKKDFHTWIDSLHASRYFQGYFINENNDQPHIFKEKMIKSLKLDVFIEDNLDIVDYLREKTDAEILWISNIFDRHEKRPLAFRNLTEAVAYIRSKYSHRA